MPVETQRLRIRHRTPRQAGGRPRATLTAALAALAGLSGGAAEAACGPTLSPGSGVSVLCQGTITGSTSVQAATNSTDVTITVDTGASLSTNATQALVVGDRSRITNNGSITVSGGSGPARAAMAATGDDNVLTNNGSIRTTSSGTAGMATPSGSSTRSTLTNTGSITTTGGSSHGIFVFGPGNTVTNSGTITVSGTASKGVYLQGGNGVANLLINTGTIRALGANTSPSAGFADAVHANTVGAASFFSRVENRAGGVISSASSYGYRGQNGNDVLVNAGLIEGAGGATQDGAIFMGPLGTGTLILQTGSVIRGAADGGGARSDTFLEGSGTVDNAFRNFQNLTMRGTDWRWTTDATFANSIRVESGRFEVSGTLSSPGIAMLPGTVVAGTGTFAGNVTNQGTWQPGPGAGNGYGAFTVRGNYVGNGALLQVNSVLGSDGSPADRLVIDGGTASGDTRIQVSNRGGTGAATVADGIVLVQAVNGATTTPTAFALAQPVEAGAYAYRLFRGGANGATGDATQSWYLRTNALAVGGAVVGSPEEAAAVIAEAAAAHPGAPPPAVAPVTLYRPEVALYSTIPIVVRQLGIAQLGTFNERQGDTGLLLRDANAPASWARVFGQRTKQQLNGDARPQFDGTLSGLQVGHDLLSRRGDGGSSDRAGLMAGYTRASGDASGMADGATKTQVGQLVVEGYSLGAYWTHIGTTGWYSDAVLMGTRYKADALSTLGRGGKPRGDLFTASIEAGYPVALGGSAVLEPQAQLIWQRSSLDDIDDGIATVRFDNDNAVMARLGARLYGTVGSTGAWKPYLKLNLWHALRGSTDAVFGASDAVQTQRNASALELGAGITGQVSTAVSLYAGLSATRALGATELRSVQGQVGLRVHW
ncbi:autotransporter family protein [Variovorax boronicumulans]|uniref:autotransporter family protein n=1 Tax=Variovorax boronicumulans TaxID=436515 RepID=UPI001C58B5EB